MWISVKYGWMISLTLCCGHCCLWYCGGRNKHVHICAHRWCEENLVRPACLWFMTHCPALTGVAGYSKRLSYWSVRHTWHLLHAFLSWRRDPSPVGLSKVSSILISSSMSPWGRFVIFGYINKTDFIWLDCQSSHLATLQFFVVQNYNQLLIDGGDGLVVYGFYFKRRVWSLTFLPYSPPAVRLDLCDVGGTMLSPQRHSPTQLICWWSFLFSSFPIVRQWC